MKRIIVLGAGLSANALIEYLLQHAEQEDWYITVADIDQELAQRKIGNSDRAKAAAFDSRDESLRAALISEADLVISMLPATHHVEIVKECIEQKKNVITPSYVSPEMKALDEAASNAGILVLNEIGVDPGIDHMSAMRLLDRIRSEGGEMVIFESFTGGLIAPESDDNPWHYKFTWNPRNVVMAGAGGAVKFRQNEMYKYIPYHKLFRRTETIDIKGHGKFEGYANRDSLRYRSIYGLDNIPTIYRGTLRYRGFCRAWDVFVQLGMTDDSYLMENASEITHRQFTNSFLAYNPNDSVELKLRAYLKIDQDSDLLDKLKWMGMFDNEPIGINKGTPAQILQHILEKKWTLGPEDRDMLVMWHKMGFRLNGEDRQINTHLVVKGTDREHTAMAKTVGLPVGIAAKLLLHGKFTVKGVKLPVVKEIYDPVLQELEQYDIRFEEEEVEPRFY